MIGQLELSEPAQPITGSGRSKSRYQTQTQNIVGSIQQNCSIWTQAAVAVGHPVCDKCECEFQLWKKQGRHDQ